MNRFLAGFTMLWIISWIVILMDAGHSLPYAPPDRLRFLFGEVFTGATVLVLIAMARKRPPVDHRNDFSIHNPRAEAIGLIVYLLAVIAVGAQLGLHTHVASVGLNPGTLHAWGLQTPASLLLWAGYFLVAGVVVPLLFFVLIRRYSLRSLLLSFPEPKKWIPYAAITAVLSLSAFVRPDFFRLPLRGHAIALLLFSLGTFLPVMVLTQSLLAPRLAVLTKSWVSGSVLAGLVYGLYHSGEFYFAWGTLMEAAVSLAWMAQFAYFGVLKAVTTLRTGSAWIHIFNTHMPHLAEAPEVMRVLSQPQ
ncbi:MAG: hypothetical protein L0099_12435 [Acidobacteria bacterium]|nr:hypothetical protein [Acidobacteriota bacterium]